MYVDAKSFILRLRCCWVKAEENYLVRSGYQLALKQKHKDIPSCSNQNSSQWNIIWKLMVPEKVKIFLWRAAKNLLPTAENLRKKRVMQEATCPICKNEIESIAHALLFCKFARKVWRYSSLGIDLKAENFPDVITLLHHSYQHHSNLNGELVASFLWVIWNARNNWLFKGKCEDPSRLIAKAMSIADSVKRIKQPEHNFSLELTSMQQNQWSPPREDWVKVNVDATMDEQNNLAGLGAVIRNYRGEVVAAAVNTVKSFGDVEMYEAKAARNRRSSSSSSITNRIRAETQHHYIEPRRSGNSFLSQRSNRSSITTATSHKFEMQ